MAAATSSTPIDHNFNGYLPLDSLNRDTYKFLTIQFSDAGELSYAQKVKLLNKVIKDLGCDQNELCRKIAKIANKYGVNLTATDSDEAILAYLAECSKIVNPEYRLKRLVPFVYELIRKGKIHKVLDRVVQALSECSIELQEDSLKVALGKGLEKFTVVLSTQLCENDKLLYSNSIEALKYCFPYVNDMMPALADCLRRLKMQDYPYEKLRILLRSLFKRQYETLCSSVVVNDFCNSLPIRVAFAEAVFRVNPDYLAENFLYLFSEEEIFCDFRFSGFFKDLMNVLIFLMRKKIFKSSDYFEIVFCYLNQWRDNPRLRIGGSERIRIMFKERVETNSFAIDKHFSKDTPVWREFFSIVGIDGIDHLFKLDWDFDYLNLRTAYVRKRLEAIEKLGYTHEISALFFPALVQVTFPAGLTSWWASLLGYSLWIGSSGMYMTLPDPATLMNRWKTVILDQRASGVYKCLSIAETEGTATTDEFIALFMEHDAVLSRTTEFVHDHQFHFLRTVEAIMNSSAEEYLSSLNTARDLVRKAQRNIKNARNNRDQPFDETMFKVLELMLGIIVDNYTNYPDLKRRNQYLNDVFIENQVFNTWDGATGSMWRYVFKEYNITHDLYPASRIQEYWDRIVKEMD